MGGLSGIHPIARFVASIVEAGPVEIVASIALISLRSDMKMRTGLECQLEVFWLITK